MARFRSALLVGLILMVVDSPVFPSEPTPIHSTKAMASRRQKFHHILDNATKANDAVHDALLGLVTVGDSSSVPHLIRGLRLFPDSEIEGKNVGLVCTHRHCVHALERITGAKAGVSYSSWKAWWNLEHPNQAIGGSNG